MGLRDPFVMVNTPHRMVYLVATGKAYQPWANLPTRDRAHLMQIRP